MVSRRFSWLWMLPVLLMAFGLGIRMLNIDLLSFDESKTMLFSGAAHYGPRDLPQLWSAVAAYDPWQSPGYYTVVGFWGRLAGWGEFGTRSISLFAGVMAIALMYRLGRCLFSAQVGLYSALILASNAFVIWYFHELRTYTFLLLLTILTVLAYWHIIHKSKSGWSVYLALVLGTAGLAYSHPLGTLTPIALAMYHLFFVPKKRAWWRVPLLFALSLLLFLPWLGVIIKLVGIASSDARQGMTDIKLMEQLAVALSNGNIAFIFVLLGMAFLQRDWLKKDSGRLVLTWLGGVLLLIVILNQITPVFIHVRYLMPTIPALTLLVALGFVNLQKHKVKLLLVLGVWVAFGAISSLDKSFFQSLYHSPYSLPAAGFHEGLEILAKHSQAEDVIALRTSPPQEEWWSEQLLDYYLYPRQIYEDYFHINFPRPLLWEADEMTYLARLEEAIGDAPLIWTMIIREVETSRRELTFFRYLQSNYAHCHTFIDSDDFQMELYAAPPQKSAVIFPKVGDGQVKMTLYWDLPDIVARNDSIDLLQGWQVNAAVPQDTYSVALHVFDSNNVLVKQVDFGLPNDRSRGFDCTYHTLDLQDLAVGTYQLHMVIYAWENGKRVSGMHDGDNELTDSVNLLSFSVTEP